MQVIVTNNFRRLVVLLTFSIALTSSVALPVQVLAQTKSDSNASRFPVPLKSPTVSGLPANQMFDRQFGSTTTSL